MKTFISLFALFLSLSLTAQLNTANWFYNDREEEYKQALAIDPATILNIYTTKAGGYLGYSYLPSSFAENNYMQQKKP